MTAATPDARGGWLARTFELLEMIKFQHALFALPFALSGLLAAARGLPELRVVVLAIACLVSARTAAMTWNRIADREFDAENPRTRDRALATGRVGLKEAWLLLLLSALAFVGFSAALNRLVFVLSPVALLIVLGYSWTKRFTWATHFVLGLALALAPIGAWIAVRGSLSTEPLLLGAAVAAWTAGFDILYACQDVAFDRSRGLLSVPARFGVRWALNLSRRLHAATLLALVGFGLVGHRGPTYFATIILAAAILAWSHSVVRPDDLSRVGVAFFQANVAVGTCVLVGVAADLALS